MSEDYATPQDFYSGMLIAATIAGVAVGYIIVKGIFEDRKFKKTWNLK